jgi:hypothetical protein
MRANMPNHIIMAWLALILLISMTIVFVINLSSSDEIEKISEDPIIRRIDTLKLNNDVKIENRPAYLTISSNEIIINNENGKTATINFSGDVIKYSGDLLPDKSSYIFFKYIYDYLNQRGN